MQRARLRLVPEHFLAKHHADIYTVIEAFYDRYATVIELDLFVTVLSNKDTVDASRRVALEQVFRQLTEMKVPDYRFQWGMDQLVERASQRKTGEAISEAWQILQQGWEDMAHPGEILRGHEHARAHLYGRLSEIDRDEYGDVAPEGDMRHESDHALSDYVARKERDLAGEHIGIMSGIDCIDRTTGGLQPGELALTVGYTTAGKSHFCTNWAWHTAVETGGDIAFFTTETVRDQVKRRFYARHSRLPMFGRPGGINSKDIRNGTLSAADEEIFRAVVEDLNTNPSYGGIHLAQVPNQATMSYLETRLRELGRKADIRLCIIDYLALIRGDVKRDAQREEHNDVLRAAKQMATSFNNGAGVAVISPWQVQQSAYRQAIEHRAYTLTNLADTSEAEKVSDTIMAILREPDDTRSARLQFLKIRDGDMPGIQEVAIDFRTSYYGDQLQVSVSTGAVTPAGARSSLDDYIP